MASLLAGTHKKERTPPTQVSDSLGKSSLPLAMTLTALVDLSYSRRMFPASDIPGPRGDRYRRQEEKRTLSPHDFQMHAGPHSLSLVFLRDPLKILSHPTS